MGTNNFPARDASSATHVTRNRPKKAPLAPPVTNRDHKPHYPLPVGLACQPASRIGSSVTLGLEAEVDEVVVGGAEDVDDGEQQKGEA